MRRDSCPAHALRKAVLFSPASASSADFVHLLRGNTNTNSSAPSWSAWGKWLRSTQASEPCPEALSHEFDDDEGAFLIHYLCCGSLLSLSSPTEETARGKAVTQRAQASSPGRVRLLAWLLEPEQSDLWAFLSLNAISNRCLNAVHCCCLNGGCADALRLLLEGLPPELQGQKPEVYFEDAHQRTPLDLAFAGHNWDVIRLLLRHGAISGSRSAHAAHEHAATVLPPPTNSGRVRGASLPARAVHMLMGMLLWLCPGVCAYAAAMAPAWLHPLLRWATPAGDERTRAIEAKVAAQHQATQAPVLLTQAPHPQGAAGGSPVLARVVCCNHARQASPTASGTLSVRQAPSAPSTPSVYHAPSTSSTPQVCQATHAPSTPSVCQGPSAPSTPSVYHAPSTSSTPPVSEGVCRAFESHSQQPGDMWGGSRADGGGVVEYEVFGTPAAVVERMQVKVVSLSELLGVNLPTATQLLLHHNFDVAAALEEGYALKLRGDTSTESKQHSAVWSQDGLQGESHCLVCSEDFCSAHFSVHMPCGHACCDACWHGILNACMDEGDTHKACCPEPGCRLPLPHSFAPGLLPVEKHDRWVMLMAAHYIQCAPDAACCPARDCGRSIHLIGSSNAPSSRPSPSAAAAPSSSPPPHQLTSPVAAASEAAPCASTGPSEGLQHALAVSKLQAVYGRGANVECACSARFCFGCRAPPHEPATCQQVEAWQQLMHAEVLASEMDSVTFISCHTKQCPRCKSRVERAGGCNHMRCSCCGTDWCWACGQEWSLHSRATGGFYRCYLAAGPGGSARTTRQGPNAQRLLFQEYLPAFLHACEERLTRVPALAGRMAWLVDLLPSTALDAGHLSSQEPSTTPQQLRSNVLKAQTSPHHHHHHQQQQHLQGGVPQSVAAVFLQDWLDCVSDSLEVLRWAIVLNFSMAVSGMIVFPSCRYLEVQVAHLSSTIEQLLAPLERMPHASQVPITPHSDTASASDSSLYSVASSLVPKAMLSRLKRVTNRLAGSRGIQASAAALSAVSSSLQMSGHDAPTSASSVSSDQHSSTKSKRAFLSRLFPHLSKHSHQVRHDRGLNDPQDHQHNLQHHHHHHHHQQQQQQQQQRGDIAADIVHVPPKPHCPMLVAPPTPTSGGAQALEQLLYATALLSEPRNVNRIWDLIQEAVRTRACITQAARAGCFSSPSEADAERNRSRSRSVSSVSDVPLVAMQFTLWGLAAWLLVRWILGNGVWCATCAVSVWALCMLEGLHAAFMEAFDAWLAILLSIVPPVVFDGD